MPDAGGVDSGAPAARKAALRREIASRLAVLDPERARRSARAVTERVLALPELASARRVLICLSFGHELDTWPLVGALVDRGRELFVPRADPRDRRLHVHPYPCELERLGFGLRQPPLGAPELATEAIDDLDLVLVLGVAFDRRGVRLGHGAGYFDRFLAAHPLVAIGLAHDVQLVDRLPDEPHDRRMHLVVSEREVVDC